MTEAVARDIVRQHNGNPTSIAVALAETISADGRWAANVCKPLLQAYEIARLSRRPLLPNGDMPTSVAERQQRTGLDDCPDCINGCNGDSPNCDESPSRLTGAEFIAAGLVALNA